MQLITIALFHSYHLKDEEFWDTTAVGEQYGVTIADTTRKDWGGESIFTVLGLPANLTRLANHFNACTYGELAPVVA